MRNYVKLGVFSKDTVLCGEYWLWLGGSLGDCRPALPKGGKYQMVKTQSESHDWQILFLKGLLEFVKRSPKLSSSRLANTTTNPMFRIYSIIQKIFLRACSNTICTKFNVHIGAG